MQSFPKINKVDADINSCLNIDPATAARRAVPVAMAVEYAALVRRLGAGYHSAHSCQTDNFSLSVTLC